MAPRIVRNNLAAVLQHLRRAAILRMDEGGDVIEAVSHQLVPVDTGALQASRQRKGKGTARQLVRYGNGDRGGEVDYALLVEADQPFLRPAAEQGAQAIARKRA